MTERQPPGATHESWVERQIREARDRGEFENLPGAGKPLPSLGDDNDELWWVKGMLRREGLSVTPPALALRKEVHDLQERLDREPTESRVRHVVEELNGRIRQANRMPPVTGPPTSVSPLDVDEIVVRWKVRRGAA